MLQLLAAERLAAQHRIGGEVCWAPAAEVRGAGLQRGHLPQDLPGQGSAIKISAAALRQSFQCACQLWIAKGLIGRWWLAIRQVERSECCVVPHPDALGQADRTQQPRAGKEAIARQLDRRLQRAAPAQSPELLMGLPEQRHRSGDADRIEPCRGLAPGHGFSGWRQQVARPAAPWCDFTPIQHLQVLLLAVPIKKKATTSEAGALGFNNGQHGLGCDQSIGCGATLFENSQGC